MAAGIITIPIPWCAAATGSFRSISTCRAARPPPRHWSTASCNCKRKSAGQGRFSVAEEIVDIMRDTMAALPGAIGAYRERGELVVQAERTAAYALFRSLRDKFGFQQMMDICGVDWPQRAARFDVVYNLLSVTRNERLRVVVQTDEQAPLASVSAIWPCAVWWEREVWDLFGI